LDWNALTPKPCRKPFGIAGAPMIPAVAMTAFTYRHAVVRLQAQSRLVESCGSRCAIRSLNARVSPRSKSGGSGTCLITPRLRRFKVSMQATPLSDRRRRQRQHFRDTRAAPAQRQAKQSYRQRRQARGIDRTLPFGGVEIFPITGRSEEALAVVWPLAHRRTR